jgi:hypothetical protein
MKYNDFLFLEHLAANGKKERNKKCVEFIARTLSQNIFFYAQA